MQSRKPQLTRLASIATVRSINALDGCAPIRGRRYDPLHAAAYSVIKGHFVDAEIEDNRSCARVCGQVLLEAEREEGQGRRVDGGLICTAVIRVRDKIGPGHPDLLPAGGETGQRAAIVAQEGSGALVVKSPPVPKEMVQAPFVPQGGGIKLMLEPVMSSMSASVAGPLQAFTDDASAGWLESGPVSRPASSADVPVEEPHPSASDVMVAIATKRTAALNALFAFLFLMAHSPQQQNIVPRPCASFS
jgi:hypothetical protein